jgi:hypothetical protein
MVKPGREPWKCGWTRDRARIPAPDLVATPGGLVATAPGLRLRTSATAEPHQDVQFSTCG